jgi:hypothetical protein
VPSRKRESTREHDDEKRGAAPGDDSKSPNRLSVFFLPPVGPGVVQLSSYVKKKTSHGPAALSSRSGAKALSVTMRAQLLPSSPLGDSKTKNFNIGSSASSQPPRIWFSHLASILKSDAVRQISS